MNDWGASSQPAPCRTVLAGYETRHRFEFRDRRGGSEETRGLPLIAQAVSILCCRPSLPGPVMLELALHAFVTFMVVLDPLGLLPIFASLTQGTPLPYRRRMALKGVIIGTLVLLVFAISGRHLLELLGIGLAAFRIAGGVMLFLIALEMLFEKRTARRSRTASELKQVEHDRSATAAAQPEDISVFPIAIPLLAGPGAITAVMLLMGQHSGDTAAQVMILIVLLAIMTLALVLFLQADRLERLLGETLSTVLSRLLGILLGALAVQFVLDGIHQALL